MSMTDVEARTETVFFSLLPLPGASGGVSSIVLGGKEKLISFGTYPEVPLADAREKRDAARKQVAAGIDPGEVRKAKKEAQKAVSENSFEVVAREWHSKYSKMWSVVHAASIIELNLPLPPCECL